MAEDPLDATQQDSLLDARILAALQTAPQTAIPRGFAARVAAQLPPRPALVLTRQRYGLVAASACVVVLMALMLLFAHGAARSPYFLIIESILCLQFVLLTVWIVARNAGYTLPNHF